MKPRKPLKRTALKRSKSASKALKDKELAVARIETERRAKGRCEAMTPVCRPGCRGDQAHHRKMRSQGGTHDLSNLLWVCSPGHAYIHANPAESYERGWLLHSWD